VNLGRDVFGRYKVLGMGEAPSMDERILSNMIWTFLGNFFTQNDQKNELWAIGKTKVFLRDTAINILEKNRREQFMNSVINIQKHIRTFNVVACLIKQISMKISAILLAQKSIRKWNAQLLAEFLLQEKRVKKLQTFIRVYNAKKILISFIMEKMNKIREEKEEEKRLLLEKKKLERREERKKQEEQLNTEM